MRDPATHTRIDDHGASALWESDHLEDPVVIITPEEIRRHQPDSQWMLVALKEGQ